MLQLKFNNNWHDIDFYGIKVIETTFTTKFIKEILTESFEESKLIVDDKSIHWNNVIYINEMAKPKDFLSLSKSNFLYRKILEFVEDKYLINKDLVDFIVDKVNKELASEDLLLPQYDISKIISACFELNDSGYLENEKLFNLLNKLDYNEKKLIIFDNVKFATYKNCQKILNNFNILVICSDLREIISSPDELEICCIARNDIFEIVNVDKLISYLEMKISQPVSKQDLHNFLLKKSDQKSSLINFYLKNL